MAVSSTVASGDLILAAHHNDLRDDVLNTSTGHMHDGTNGRAHGDAVSFTFGDGPDAGLRWSTGDSSNHAYVLGLGDSNQAFHITDLEAIATDWNIAATTHPNVYIHSNTTPATDYLRLGDHDGTTAYVDVVGGTTLALEIAGTTAFSMIATALLAGDAAGPALANEAATTTNPTLIPNRAELDTGIGWASDVLHVVLGGNSEYSFSGTTFAVGTNSITMSGSLGVTGTRLTKGWFTDLEVSNAIAGSITGNAATVTTITGLAPDTATTQAAQANVTSLGTLTGLTMDGAIDMNANALNNVADAGNDWTANLLQMSSANAGAKNSFTVENTSTDASSIAEVRMKVPVENTNATVDPILTLQIVGAQAWGIGIDNSASDRFSISSVGLPGNTDVMRISTSNVITYDTTHPTGTFDYVCGACGQHGPVPFSCCGPVEWHSDMLALEPVLGSVCGQRLTGREPGIQHLAKLGVLDLTLNSDGSPEVFIDPVAAQWYTWSGMRQMHRRIEELEKQLAGA
ncbi:hypothetical protein CMI37_20305 [Candidatus Pacearchaeota archaeon]|nr:hypothetical protein [Candidatus Pacearchaeota archaeon]